MQYLIDISCCEFSAMAEDQTNIFGKLNAKNKLDSTIICEHTFQKMYWLKSIYGTLSSNLMNVNLEVLLQTLPPLQEQVK